MTSLLYNVCEECDEIFLRHIMKALKCFTNVTITIANDLFRHMNKM